jgi:hypothetical protein
MPPIEDGRAVAAGFPAPAGAALIPALPGLISRLIPVGIAAFVRPALESLVSFSIAHGRACLTGLE